MTKKPVLTKIFAMAAAFMTMTVMCGLPDFAFASETGVTKEETVYVVTDNTGTQQDVIVSDHLINKGGVKTISDKTNLSDVENVKGEETFKQDGENLTWDAEGKGIYYQGKSADEIPVSLDVTYRLDGKVVSGSELQGKSGNVEIKINYENDAEYEGTTVPFIVMTGMIITDESFKDVKIDHGKVIDDGEKLLVVGMAAPGLAQTLDIGETDLGIGSSVTITGTADEFAVEDMMTVVTNSVFEDVDTDKFGDLDYDDEIAQLDKGAKALVEGSAQLYAGLDKLNSSVPKLEEGVSQLDQGANKLSNGLPNLLEGAKLAKAGSSAVYNGLLGVKTALGTGDGSAKNPGLSKVLSQVKGGVTAASENLTQAETLTSGAKTKVDDASNNLESASTELNSVSIDSVDLGSASSAIQSAIDTIDNDESLTSEQKTNLKNILNTAKDNVSSAQKSANSKMEANNESVTNAKNYVNAAKEGNSSASDLLDSASKLESRVKDALDVKLSTGVAGAETINNTVLGNLGDKDTEKTLINGAYAVSTGLGNMETGISSADSGAQQLAAGLDELYDQSGTLVDGANKLDSGAYKLSVGMSKLYKEGIKKIVDLYQDDLKGTLDSVDSMMDAGKGYKTFTRLPSGMDGNVKFIYKTDITE